MPDSEPLSLEADAAVLDVAYRLDLDDDTWLSALAEALRTRYRRRSGVLACRLEVAAGDRGMRVARTASAGPVDTFSRHALEFCESAPGETVRSLIGEETGASTLHRRLAALELDLRDLPQLAAAREHIDFDDIWAMSAAAPESDVVLFVSPVSACEMPPTGELAAATKLAEHIAAAARARDFLATRPDDHGLVFSPEGRLEHADGTPVPEELTDALTRAVATTERARSEGQQEFRIRDAELLWDDILDEGWRLAHYTDVEGKRLIVGVRPEDACRAQPALTPREREVVTLASKAATNKEIAAELGLSLSTVATHLRNALAKLHVGSRRELIALRRAITGLVEGS